METFSDDWLDKIGAMSTDVTYEQSEDIEDTTVIVDSGIRRNNQEQYETFMCDVHIGDFELLDDAREMKKQFKYINREIIGRSVHHLVKPKGKYKLNITNIHRLLKGVKKK